jgi:hypothetical protein
MCLVEALAAAQLTASWHTKTPTMQQCYKILLTATVAGYKEEAGQLIGCSASF